MGCWTIPDIFDDDVDDDEDGGIDDDGNTGGFVMLSFSGALIDR